MQRPRFRLRTLMILVALVAVLGGIPLYWMSWLRRANQFGFGASVYARLQPRSGTYVAGEIIPVEIKYNLEMSTAPKPPAGMFFRLKLDTRLEDAVTGAVIDRYTIYRHLVSGVREKSEGTIPWQIRFPRRGQYFIKYEMKYMDPFGTWKSIGSGGNGYTAQAFVGDPHSALGGRMEPTHTHGGQSREK
jgi:hypothetical protein